MNRILRLLCICLLLIGARVMARADEILVSAAASLTNAFNEIGTAFTKTGSHTTVRFNFAASGALQQQIEQGAPVDVFASAAPKEMDALQQGGHIESETRIDFAGNRLVLIVKPGSSIRNWSDLTRPDVRHVAISDPRSVPSGRYAQATLTKRGLWATVQPKAVFGEDVRQTLAYVAGGDAEAGIVYSTDAQIAGKQVHTAVEAIPGKDHDPIVYPIAVVKGAPNPAVAQRFVQFLRGPLAQSILKRYGFAPAPRAPRRP